MKDFADVRSKEDLAREVREGLAGEVERKAKEIDTAELAEKAIYVFSATAVGIVAVGGTARLIDWMTDRK